MATSTWLFSPASGNYNIASNWTAGVPTDVAAFGASNLPGVFFSQNTAVNAWQLTGNYGFSVGAGFSLDFNGAGISGVAAATSAMSVAGTLNFNNSSTAGALNIDTTSTGAIDFFNTSTAASAHFTNAGIVAFHDLSSASQATIVNDNALTFLGGSTAAQSTIHNNKDLDFGGGSTAGTAHISNQIGASTLEFHSTATASAATLTNSGTLSFLDTSDAGTAQITNDNALNFSDASSAGSSAIVNHSGAIVTLTGTASAANSVIENEGDVVFRDNSSAGTATFEKNSSLSFSGHSSAAQAYVENSGGYTRFSGSATAGSAVITGLGSSNDIIFIDNSTAGNATLSSNWTVDFSASAGLNNDSRVSAGSIAGSGRYRLGKNELTVGSNNLSTVVTGTIEDKGTVGNTDIGASLVKVGTGTLTLSGANTYTGGTTVNKGVLQVDGTVLNGVAVNSGGALGGKGTITGTVTVNSGGSLAPGASAGALTTGGLVFNSSSTFKAEIGGLVAGSQHDVVLVNGTVTITNAAFTASLINGFDPSLTARQQFEIIDNDGSDAVVGHFGNAFEGETLAMSQRLFTITYKGGTGNDVVLISEGAFISGTEAGETINGSTAPAGQYKTTPLVDYIRGLGGRDKISSGAGNDTIQGGAGKDAIDGGAGKDTADYTDTTTGVTVKLNGAHKVTVKVGGKNDDTLKNVENVDGGSGKDKFTGDSKDNVFRGLSGKDTLTGNGGKDHFVFATTFGKANADTVTDFKHKTDKLGLDDLFFTAIGSALDKDEFYAKAGATKATDATDRIIYNKTNGNLYYDADGVGGTKAVLFATLSNHPGNLDFKDFEIV